MLALSNSVLPRVVATNGGGTVDRLKSRHPGANEICGDMMILIDHSRIPRFCS